MMAVLAVVCLASLAHAIDPNQMLSQYIRDRWGVEKGLTVGSVTSIAQTPDGYLWIGSDKGLVRFDGLTFRLFQQAIPTTFSIGAVHALTTDAEGNLWILLQNTRILRYENGKFELGREEVESGITSVGRRADGTVLFSSVTLGALSNRGGRFEILTSPADRAPAEGTATTEADNRNTRFSWATQLVAHRFAAPNSVVISIAETSDGRVWLGTQDKGLFYMSGGKVLAARRGQFNYRINCLLALENRELWVGTDRGLVRWNGAEVTSAGVPSPLRHVQILSMVRDHDGSIWVGTVSGLIRVSDDVVSVDRGVGAVTALFEDREGNLWIGTSQVLQRLRNSAFVTYSDASLKSRSTGALYVDPEGKTWFAPSEGGLRWLKGGKSQAVAVAGLSQDIVYSISSSRQNELWVGRQRGGLTHLSNVNGSMIAKTYTQPDGLPQNAVYAVHQSRDGTVWSATLSGGVSEYNGRHFTTYTTANGLASNRVSSIAEGADGTMWFGTATGLSELRKNNWRTYSVQDGLSSLNVNCLLPDSKGLLWIGTADGLAFLSADHQIHVPQRVPDSIREAVFGIAEDRDGHLWVATANHILQLQRNSLIEDAVTEADVREYGMADGLSGTEGVQRYQSVVADSRGRVWFSTNGGLSSVDPSRAAATSVSVLVHIEGVAGDGTAFDLRGPIHFPPGTRRTTFRYVGLSLSNSERVRYRYRLDGVDRNWSEAGTNREATYNNLGAGTYRFRVMASNSYGIWNDTDASIDFSVLPEFYQTNWFRMSSVAAFFAFLWGIYQLRVQQLQRQFNVALDARVNERMRIARELHDTLLQTLHGLMFRFQAARNLFARRPGEALEAMDSAIKRTEQAIAESRDAIKDLRIEHSSSSDLGELLTTAGQELETSIGGDSNGPTFQLIVAGERQDLSPGIRDEVFRIGRELLRNAFQHAHALHIEAEIRYADHALTLLVRDDGRGIDPAVVKAGGRPGHWGLPGIRERAKQIRSELDFWTENRAGTEVQLLVPASVAYKASFNRSVFKLFRGERVL
jgi:ligand-binding sensor domain-containing protein